MPLTKYSFALSSERLAKGRTAIDLGCAAFAATAAVAGPASGVAASRDEGRKRPAANAASASASITRIMRSIRRAVRGAVGPAGSSAASRLSPCGVHSNTQANASAGRKPMARRTTTLRASHSGAPNSGSTVAATCTTSHAPTRYRPAMRSTLRRLSSASRLMAADRIRSRYRPAAGTAAGSRACANAWRRRGVR